MPITMKNTETSEDIHMSLMVVRARTEDKYSPDGYTYYPVLGSAFDAPSLKRIGTGAWIAMESYSLVSGAKGYCTVKICLFVG